MCTMAFNKFFAKNVDEYIDSVMGLQDFDTENEYLNVLIEACEKGAYFDCRAFNIPKEEVTNNFYWRQLDCSRNSIQMVGQANFSHKELQNKSCSQIQDMLMLQKGINWNDLPTYQKRGSCCIKEEYQDHYILPDMAITKTRWIIDKEIPIFKGEGRQYIEKLVNFD